MIRRRVKRKKQMTLRAVANGEEPPGFFDFILAPIKAVIDLFTPDKPKAPAPQKRDNSTLKSLKRSHIVGEAMDKKPKPKPPSSTFAGVLGEASVGRSSLLGG